MAITWPVNLRFVSYSPPVLEYMDRSGGVSLSGGEQIIEANTGRWVQSVTTLINDAETLLAWQAFVAQVGGRGTEVLMPVTSCLTQPGGVTKSFADVGGVEVVTYNETITASLGSAAAKNASTLTIDSDEPILPGHYVGLVDRLHHVSAVSTVSAGRYSVTVRPWTRAAYASGTQVLFRTAVCKMRLRDATQLRQPLDLGRFARPTLDFVESF